MVWRLLLAAQIAWAADLPVGRIVNDVKCAADATQGYALYLPSNYSTDRTWPVIFAFDPAARGSLPVERYRDAAERYGYIVAGSNNSRNGPAQIGAQAAQAMFGDVGKHFPIDGRRIYLAGMSGGARVAMAEALGRPGIAGVIASSAGFPDSVPRKEVPFAVCGTAGTEDFNLMEMRLVDRTLKSAHRLLVFQGGHTWLSSEVAMQAVEWLEIQAVKSGSAAKSDRVEQIFAKRVAAVEALESEKDRYVALLELAADFDGLKDVASFRERAASMARSPKVRAGLKLERDEESLERREMQEILALEKQLGDSDQRMKALHDLRSAWRELLAAANRADDSIERRTARRVLRGLYIGARERGGDADYLKMLEEFRPPR